MEITEEEYGAAYAKQYKMEKKVIDDLKRLGADDVLISKVDNFFDDLHTAKPFKTPTAQVFNGRYGVRWDDEQGYLSVLFGPDDNWQWDTKTTVGKNNDDECGQYSRHLKYEGGPSFTLDKPYYILPDEVENVIKLPDLFVGTYQPMIPKREYKVWWTTGYWDGMLSGYIKYKGNLCYFDNIEETTYTRNRMFVIYQLSLIEKIVAYYRHFKWNVTLYNRLLWNIHNKMWKWKNLFQKRRSTEYYTKRKEKWANSHKVLGYFSWD